ncbi:type I restriction endonuclease subunit R [Komagataeibacter rhaeticus]|uniref:type I restriction endonuclease subunit R n=1 Tax=Komagataeibacter rhaeticus TaxID=215221 RepID=UPI0004D4D589|nr:type I restriction endonuclease subunit R [Komagataeibacter rhaeticus]KDU97515.1 DEAD/DEAH box helicase [Komagataeibacter rhaeticus AF1]MBL7239176.1 type I restriction endonuclease subunit R [Komagataeibacter rhaeticus]PYD53811.1 type I restriction endonuclease subunit R [Komagataeibacter rhaeticus]GBQ10205.1 HsdR family type I site-specific deoxyribonuclease [Komagataeibacter rhaeticus DSM 16663]
MSFLSENEIEDWACDILRECGYAITTGSDISPGGAHAERDSLSDVILNKRLQAAIDRLNPHLSQVARDEALRALKRDGMPDVVDENRRLHGYLVDGVPVDVVREDGTQSGDRARLIDFDHPERNDFLAVRQFVVEKDEASRRPDIVLFVNGLPVGMIELKSPSSEQATLDAAWNQFQSYRSFMPSLFRFNEVLVISDGTEARVGSLTADRERFMPWRTVDGEELVAKNHQEMETVLRGVFTPRWLLALIRDFVLFTEKDGSPIKILAAYHQFHACRKAVAQTVRATARGGNRKAGVIWHTQGSGKSLLMTFYAGVIARHPAMENPTIVVLTDRNDLDDQLFATFSGAQALLRQTPEQAGSRDELRTLLRRASGGVIFTTLQKFQPEGEGTGVPLLTDRRNVVVMADEAHRSQYGLEAKFNSQTGRISYGFAKYLRDALPNASFIGFTGTPIETADVNTRAIFGDYIDIYDIAQAVEDGATVPIYYESRLVRVELDDDVREGLDDELAEIVEGLPESEEQKLSRKYSRLEALVGAEQRLRRVAGDLVRHFENRLEALDGKGMIVGMSRAICVALYDEIIRIRPDWHSDDDNAGAIKVVMTGCAADPAGFQPHIGRRARARRDLLARRMKDNADPLKLVIVRDMWLTGFDAPALHTMYVDKPMRGHGLMQAIARVNRVFRGKPGGLVVDYIGLARNLKAALGEYSAGDRQQVGIDEAEAVRALQERYEIVRAMFSPEQAGGFDYRPALVPGTAPGVKLAIMAGALDRILGQQQYETAQATTDEGRKAAQRRFPDAVRALSVAFALASASDQAAVLRDEVGFFEAVRAVLVKRSGDDADGRSPQERELAIRQLVSRAVVSTDIIDIMEAAGIGRPDISILSDAFLQEVREMPHRNLAIEALRKLLEDQIRSRRRSNLTEAETFSIRLEQAVSRYHANALTSAQILDELIRLAHEMAAARVRGEELGLTPEEMAFYDALARNESARMAMGDPGLRAIATALVRTIRANATVDWTVMASARARMRTAVRRLLRKYGYPPDMQGEAVQNILHQAEEFAPVWADSAG